MSTVFHVGTYLQMGTDFDSRWRFLRNRSDGVYEGVIASGETWDVDVDYDNWADIILVFRMDGYVLDFNSNQNRIAPPAGTVTRVSSE